MWRLRLGSLCLLLLACGDDSAAVTPDGAPGNPDASRDAPVDAAMPMTDAGQRVPTEDGGVFTGGSADPVPRPLTPISVTQVGGLSGMNVLDVAVDSAGNVWASTDHFVEYIPRGGTPRRYTAADGLALGDASKTFAAVGAGLPGQAFIGTIGKYADVVNVRGDGSLNVHHLTITEPYHAMHVTMVWRFAVDLTSAWGGTVWIGAEHGHAAVHGIATGYCWGADGCFEEHRHSDPSGGPAGDVRGLAVCPNHDLWTGDAWWVARMPWGPMGTMPDFWSIPPNGYPDPLLDVFPGVNDSVYSMACDDLGGLWVGSWGDGLAHIDPTTYITHYYAAADSLPQNIVTAVLVDSDRSIWVGTGWGGIGRLNRSNHTWSYYGQASGLPTDSINNFAADFTHSPRTIYMATYQGLVAYTGP